MTPEQPLGPDAFDIPTSQEIADLWDAIKDAPIPDYETTLLRKLKEGSL